MTDAPGTPDAPGTRDGGAPGTGSPAWDPPLTGTDAEQIVAALDRQRATFRWKADGLDDAGLSQRIGASELTLGGLLNHLAFVEDLYSTLRLDDSALDERWATMRSQEAWEAHFHPTDSPADLYARYDATVARARQRAADAIAARGIDQQVTTGSDETGWASLRRLLLDLLEEYGRHTGQADLLREAVDGYTDEDPAPDWRPVWL